MKVSAAAKFITVKLSFKICPVFKDNFWVGTFTCNWTYSSAAVDVPGVLVIRCPRGVTKTLTSNSFTSLTFTVSDCATAPTLIVFTSLVLPREAITMWPAVLAFVFRARLKGMTLLMREDVLVPWNKKDPSEPRLTGVKGTFMVSPG